MSGSSTTARQIVLAVGILTAIVGAVWFDAAMLTRNIVMASALVLGGLYVLVSVSVEYCHPKNIEGQA